MTTLHVDGAPGARAGCRAVVRPPAPLARRRAALLLGSLATAPWLLGRQAAGAEHAHGGTPGSSGGQTASVSPKGGGGGALLEQAVAQVTPEAGFASRVRLGDSVLKLVAAGVIEPGKFLALRHPRPASPRPLEDPLGLAPGHALVAGGDDGVPAGIALALRWPSADPIHLTRANAGHHLNLLWPLGLANFMGSNRDSPINGDLLPRYASTSGWTLGREANGAAYFNRLPLVELTAEQEELATSVAANTYRPCCDNATFFQDCNHGSALLGLLELGAAQGLGEGELYREALSFNSFWFPDVYAQTAIYFKLVEGTDWADVDPRLVMSYQFSALGPWSANVQRSLQGIPDLFPRQGMGTSCAL
jgi:hypothetical protein